MVAWMNKRSSGVLLHITSLPSEFGIGDLGPWSYRFVDLLSRVKQHYWSILPLTPTNLKDGNSPYQPRSAFAGNTLLVSPELLVKDKLLPEEYVGRQLKLPRRKVDYGSVTASKKAMLRKAYTSFAKSFGGRFASTDVDFETFCSENSGWLDDYALYEALEEKSCSQWFRWPLPLRNREVSALDRKRLSMKERIEEEKFAQFIFFRQWKLLRDYCHKKKISIIGDQAFYVSYDSADAWTRPEILKLDSRKRLEYVGGAPPDFFSKNGQIWRNPVYAWSELQKTSFSWWMNRIRHYLNLFDLLRLDHFRGFVAYWQVAAAAKTAKKGRWIRAKSGNFFHTLQKSFPDLPFIAEDLGVITDSVRKHMRLLGIPGMRVLLFAFDGKRSNPHLPVNHPRNSVAYTGNHDTNTARGWLVNEANDEERRRAFRCIGRTVSETEISNEFIRLALASPAFLSVVPIQDILALGKEARMNHPGHQFNNWEWRVTSEQLASKRFEEFGRLTQASERDS